MRFKCPDCGQHYEADAADIPPQIQCQRCGAVFAIAFEPVPPPEPEPETDFAEYPPEPPACGGAFHAVMWALAIFFFVVFGIVGAVACFTFLDVGFGLLGLAACITVTTLGVIFSIRQIEAGEPSPLPPPPPMPEKSPSVAPAAIPPRCEPCRACGGVMARTAAVCPHCGAKRPYPMFTFLGFLSALFWVIGFPILALTFLPPIIAVVVIFIVWIVCLATGGFRRR